MFAVLLAVTTALAYGVGLASNAITAGPPSRAELVTAAPTASPATATGTTAEPADAAPTRPRTRPAPTAAPKPRPAGGPRVLGPGDTGDRVRDLQARLKQLAWYAPDVTGRYDATTRAAVRGFQAKRHVPATGVVDRRTLRRVQAMSTTPTRGELHNLVGWSAATKAPLDARCRTGRAICVDKRSRTLRWVVDGRVRATMAVRFGALYTPTREGLFHVRSTSRDHVSRLYGSAMPFAMFFSGGQAVHYSSDFAARGYAGASHGCVNVRDLRGITWLFDQVRVGDKVVVSWS